MRKLRKRLNVPTRLWLSCIMVLTDCSFEQCYAKFHQANKSEHLCRRQHVMLKSLLKFYHVYQNSAITRLRLHWRSAVLSDADTWGSTIQDSLSSGRYLDEASRNCTWACFLAGDFRDICLRATKISGIRKVLLWRGYFFCRRSHRAVLLEYRAHSVF